MLRVGVNQQPQDSGLTQGTALVCLSVCCRVDEWFRVFHVLMFRDHLAPS
jgi:hypothetical protein